MRFYPDSDVALKDELFLRYKTEQFFAVGLDCVHCRILISSLFVKYWLTVNKIHIVCACLPNLSSSLF